MTKRPVLFLEEMISFMTKGNFNNKKTRKGIIALIAVIALALAIYLGVCVYRNLSPVKKGGSEDDGISEGSVPKRIISIAPSSTEILYALGLEENIVGVTTNCNYPPEAAEKPKVGDYKMNEEKILELNPDLVIGDASLNYQTIESLKGLGINVLATSASSVAEIPEVIRQVAKTTGREKEGEEIIARMLAEQEEITAKTAGLEESERPRVLVLLDDLLWSVGSGTFFNDLIEMAGGRNIMADSDRPWMQLNEEIILERDPDVILITYSGLTPESFMSNPVWQGLSAVKSKRVYLIDQDKTSRPGPRITQGLKEIYNLLH